MAPLSDARKEALEALAETASRSSSIALSELVEYEKEVAVEAFSFEVVGVEDLPSIVGNPTHKVLSVHFEVGGDYPLSAFLLFPADSALTMLKAVAGVDLAGGTFSGMSDLGSGETKALDRIGSALARHFTSAVSEFLRIDLRVGRPELSFDRPMSLLIRHLVKLRQNTTSILCVRVTLTIDGSEAKGAYLILPHGDSTQEFLERLTVEHVVSGGEGGGDGSAHGARTTPPVDSGTRAPLDGGAPAVPSEAIGGMEFELVVGSGQAAIAVGSREVTSWSLAIPGEGASIVLSASKYAGETRFAGLGVRRDGEYIGFEIEVDKFNSLVTLINEIDARAREGKMQEVKSFPGTKTAGEPSTGTPAPRETAPLAVTPVTAAPATATPAAATPARTTPVLVTPAPAARKVTAPSQAEGDAPLASKLGPVVFTIPTALKGRGEKKRTPPVPEVPPPRPVRTILPPLPDLGHTKPPKPSTPAQPVIPPKLPKPESSRRAVVPPSNVPRVAPIVLPGAPVAEGDEDTTLQAPLRLKNSTTPIQVTTKRAESEPLDGWGIDEWEVVQEETYVLDETTMDAGEGLDETWDEVSPEENASWEEWEEGDWEDGGEDWDDNGWEDW
ncbi:MAG: chemotaxis protein CheC [Promethearchaeota archaeon]